MWLRSRCALRSLPTALVAARRLGPASVPPVRIERLSATSEQQHHVPPVVFSACGAPSSSSSFSSSPISSVPAGGSHRRLMAVRESTAGSASATSSDDAAAPHVFPPLATPPPATPPRAPLSTVAAECPALLQKTAASTSAAVTSESSPFDAMIPVSTIRGCRRLPLCTNHPAFGQRQAVVVPECDVSRVAPKLLSKVTFDGPVSVSGFFLAVDANVCLLNQRDQMNPNAQLTIRDAQGRSSRVRYRCILRADRGIKLEALVRFQVGWISPRVTFTQMPTKIYLGKGFDISVPFLFHLTCLNILDESGHATGSSLYFSGTPFMGLSFGAMRLSGGELQLDPVKAVDPENDAKQFIGKLHYRQLGFLAFKVLVYLGCGVVLIGPVRRAIVDWLNAHLPRPVVQLLELMFSH